VAGPERVDSPSVVSLHVVEGDAGGLKQVPNGLDLLVDFLGLGCVSGERDGAWDSA